MALFFIGWFTLQNHEYHGRTFAYLSLPFDGHHALGDYDFGCGQIEPQTCVEAKHGSGAGISISGFADEKRCQGWTRYEPNLARLK